VEKNAYLCSMKQIIIDPNAPNAIVEDIGDYNCDVTPLELLHICQEIADYDNYLISYKHAHEDEHTQTLDFIKYCYLNLTASNLATEAEKYLNMTSWGFCLNEAAIYSHAWDIIQKKTIIGDNVLLSIPSADRQKPFLEWLGINQPYDTLFDVTWTLAKILDDCMNNIIFNLNNYCTCFIPSSFFSAVQHAKQDYNEEKDRCKSSDWEDKKLMLKNENIDKLKANHFGKYFYNKVYDTDTRFKYALVDRFPLAASQYIADDERTEIFDKIEEFYYLQALYCLLHDEDPIPPEFREKTTSQPENETQQTDTPTPPKEPDNYTTEERLKIINCYKGLAGFMTIDTHWITDIFKPNDDNLWAAIKADGQTPLMHPNRPDGTNIAPLLNLLGVLCYTKKLSNKPSSYYNKLTEQLTHLDKNRIASLVKNGNRKELRGLANTIKKRLDKMTEQ